MRIAFVHTDLRMYWPPRLLALGRSLRKRGDELFVIEIAGNGSPYDFAGQNRADGELAWSVLFPNGDLRQMSGRTMAKAVERKLDKLQPDVIMAGGIAFPSGAAAVRWARRNRRGVIIFDDARLEDVPRSRVTEFVKGRIYANVDAAFIPAESHVPSYIHWGIPCERIYLGVDVVDNESFMSRARVLRTSTAEFRRERGLPQRFFLGVGRHIEQKNWDACLTSYAKYQASARERPWGLVLIGDGPLRARLQELIDSRGIPDVRFPGAIYGDELVGYYVAADAFVLPSYGETWGCVVNEAMACRLPVIVSDRCGCAETLVQDGVNGWSFSPNDSAELTRRMVEISSLSDEALLKMSVASQEIIQAWGLDRFVQGAEAAIAACHNADKGFTSRLDRFLISLWNGRFRPT